MLGNVTWGTVAAKVAFKIRSAVARPLVEEERINAGSVVLAKTLVAVVMMRICSLSLLSQRRLRAEKLRD